MEENKELTLVEKVEAEAKDGFRNGLNCTECAGLAARHAEEYLKNK